MVIPMRVYIAGPIAGRTALETSTAFSDAAMHLRTLGHEPVSPLDVSPHEHEGPCPQGPAAGEGGTHSAPCYMRADVRALLECDAIYLLEGWPYSLGTRTEFEVARACGLKLMFEGKD